MKGLKERTTSLLNALGKSNISSAQAKRLDELAIGLTYSKLMILYSEAKDESTFKKVLKAKKVNSSNLHTKLANILSSKSRK